MIDGWKKLESHIEHYKIIPLREVFPLKKVNNCLLLKLDYLARTSSLGSPKENQSAEIFLSGFQELL